MEGWGDFFVAEVGAAAALAGLLVVAISINISRILSFPTLPGRAANTLVIVGGGLVIASLALLPGQPLWLFGWETLAIDLVIAISGIGEMIKVVTHRRPQDPFSWILVAGSGLVASVLPHLVGGAVLVAGNPSGLYWIAVGIILGLVATLENGWVLLVEILR